ncbi:hypothetical protein SAMN04488700_1427 [Carnobacterium iners]|uniref:DUF871 domain-containing protein n=1 Tax=Carnobacterium iners TaxID=1073423 RepID=A0A1X7N717_9LACT|nr:MupG family TIM beta-alpha barrel fold protein [Carnobacterium iners]SEK43789.1 hypothetical protein SAMN04488114_10418 [Carnobacterium iners]SMH32577.1 hypothetical protein SAMN04488700_1427 [Carnobacterium iners]
MLGTSIFLGEDLNNTVKKNLLSMKKHGFIGIFSSLHIPEDESAHYSKRLKVLGEWATELEMDVMVDISGSVLSKVGLSLDRPQEILAIGIKGIRIDYGVSNKQISDLSHFMKVSLNASTLTETDLVELKREGANFNHLEAWHNYYPRPETGLDKENFTKKNQWLKQHGFRIVAFVPGDNILRGPLFEGLPSLEKHRYSHPLDAAIELLIDCLVDDIYIGEPGLKKKTQKQFQSYFIKETMLLFAEPEQQSIYATLAVGLHQNRWDAARDVIRSADARLKKIDDIIPEYSLNRRKGSITIDNQIYGRYMGEIQICLTDLSRDKKVNVVAQIVSEDLSLLKWCKGGQSFEIMLNK